MGEVSSTSPQMFTAMPCLYTFLLVQSLTGCLIGPQECVGGRKWTSSLILKMMKTARTACQLGEVELTESY